MKPRSRRAKAVHQFAAAIAIALGLPEKAPGQIITENAGPASPELPSLREAFSVRETRNVRELRLDSQFTWSPWPTLETRTTVPYLHRDFGTTEDSGLGDVSLRLKHSLWQDDDILKSTRFAALYELTAPTGSTDEARDPSGVPLPRKLQLGAGALGLGGGAAFTVIRDRHRFSAEGFYRHTFEDDGFSLGDSLRVNLAYWYRLSPAVFSEGDDGGRDRLEVRGVLELLSSYRFESRFETADGIEDQGAEVWMAPGLQFFGRGRLLFEAGFQVPLYQDVDDDFGRRRWGGIISVKFLF